MADVVLKIPATTKSYFSSSQNAGNLSILNKIKAADYYKYIKSYSSLAKISPDLLTAIIATESNGKLVGKNAWGAIGLMQMKWGTAYDTIKKEAMDKSLTAADKDFIKTYVPELAKNNFAIKYGDFTGIDKNKVISQIETALTKPQFNILMGALHVGQLIDKFTNGLGQPYLHKSLAVYNQGIGRASLVKPFNTVNDLVNDSKLATEGKNYVLKILGTNGYLDLLLK